MKKILLATVVCFLAFLYLVIINRIGHPHFKQPNLTKEQQVMIRKAESRIGKYPIERRGYGEGYFIIKLPNGERRL